MCIRDSKRFGVADSTVGIYTAAMLLGQTFGNLGAGLLADRYGHKISLEVGLLLSSVGFVLAWLAPSPMWMFPIFAFLGMATGIFIVSGILIALEFSAPQDRPSYIGIANTSLGLGSIIAPLLGGWLALSGYAEPLARQHRFAEAIRGHSTSPEGLYPPCPVCPTLPR